MPSPLPPVNNSVLSVSALNRLVRDCLESAFPLLWVGGEISNLTRAASGHVYFSLKDGNAQVRCVIWRNRAQLLGWRPENGQKVEASALVSFYEARGEFQITVNEVRLKGLGQLYEAYEKLKAKLQAEGVFAPERKKPLPEHPRAIGIVGTTRHNRHVGRLVHRNDPSGRPAWRGGNGATILPRYTAPVTWPAPMRWSGVNLSASSAFPRRPW